MKKVLLLALVSAQCLAQPTINIWQVRPDTAICPGDTVLVNFKFQEPTFPDNTTNYFYIDNQVVWQGNWSQLTTLPQELWNGGPQWTYLIKLVTSTAIAVGNTHSVTTNAAPVFSIQSFAVKNCSCTITSAFTHTSTYLTTTLTAQAVGTTSMTQYYWDFGVSSGWQLGSPVQTFTYSQTGSYSVGLLVANPTCTDAAFVTVTVAAKPDTVITTGIEEYGIDHAPIYFDFNGQQVEKREGLLIEQVGLRRRKVYFQ